jgi:transposase
LIPWQEAERGGFDFVRPNRDQLFLIPPALPDWLSPDDLAYFILDTVARFDLTAFHAAYRADGVGQAAFQPRMMAAVLLYACYLGVRSTRQIECLCQWDVIFRVVAGNLCPEYAMVARFRQRRGAPWALHRHPAALQGGGAGQGRAGRT